MFLYMNIPKLILKNVFEQKNNIYNKINII